MKPTPEEQLKFANENLRLVAEMKQIIDAGPTIENVLAIQANTEAQRILWANYNEKYKEEKQ